MWWLEILTFSLQILTKTFDLEKFRAANGADDAMLLRKAKPTG